MGKNEIKIFKTRNYLNLEHMLEFQWREKERFHEGGWWFENIK